MLTIRAGMQLGGVPVGVPVTPSCVLVGKFGKNKFIPWHANLGAIAGKAHTVLDHGDMCLRPIMQADNRPGDDLCEYMKDSDTPLILLCTVLHRGMKTGISEASKKVSIFSFATQGGKQVSFYFRQRNWAQAREAQIRFPAG